MLRSLARWVLRAELTGMRENARKREDDLSSLRENCLHLRQETARLSAQLSASAGWQRFLGVMLEDDEVSWMMSATEEEWQRAMAQLDVAQFPGCAPRIGTAAVIAARGSIRNALKALLTGDKTSFRFEAYVDPDSHRTVPDVIAHVHVRDAMFTGGCRLG